MQIVILHSLFSTSLRGVRKWTISLSYRKDFISLTYFNLALTDVNAENFSAKEHVSFSSGSVSS